VLYRPEEFEALAEQPWEEADVRAAIARIVTDVEAAYRRQPLWPALADAPVEPGRPEPSLYAGAPGLVWALDALATRDHAEPTLDLPGIALEALAVWRAAPVVYGDFADLPQRESSLLLGEAGVLLVAWLLSEQPQLADDLHARVLANVDANEADELMWGTAGTLLAARRLLDRTGDGRWHDACRASAEALLARREADGLWRQKRFHDSRCLGPVHGYVGNVRAVLAGLDPPRAAKQRSEASEVLARYAVWEDGVCSWPPAADEGMANSRGEIRLQWCHGAPGIVATAALYLDEELLLGGAELTWRAGAHGAQKGSGICHGTAGNGYALLATFERTGDELWLDRARRFAVHALAQAEREPPAYALWVGAIGAAIFASDCLDGECRYPFLDLRGEAA
jgi:hypothetical protein